jgi:phosphopentomutase
MARAFFLVLDSLGCGSAADSAAFGDEGADTLGHIAEAVPLHMPILDSLGLGRAAALSRGKPLPGFGATPRSDAIYGYAREVSQGKDTPSGHWELAGAPADFAFGYFPPGDPAFPRELVEEIVARGKLPGILGDCHAAGVALIEQLGEEHVRTGKPILYTSVDSVLQIAAHEDIFGRQRLYDLCELVRDIVNPLHIGRVIARPFIGTDKSTFKRTPYRRDYGIAAPTGNILDRAAEAGCAIVSIGKIGDIFGHRNTGREIKGAGDMELFDRLLEEAPRLPDGGLIFANFVDLDTDFGHRRNVEGYARGLEAFDARMGQLLPLLREGDLLIVSADHGNDPTWRGTDHTREHVPVVGLCAGSTCAAIGARETFADVGASIAAHLDLQPPARGKSFIQ